MGRISIVYQDDHIIVVDKEPGMLTIGDRFTFNIPSILGTLRKQYGDIYTVHRLDKETSGLVVFAKTQAAHRTLSIQFEDKEVKKKYKAIVDGLIDEEGFIDAPIAENPFIKGRMVIHKKGKKSYTEYKREAIYQGQISLVDINLHTGRTHQIRVHMSHIGHPLFIDSFYGHREAYFLSELKGKKYKMSKGQFKEKPLISRLTLHAYSLEFNHPANGKVIKFESELPKDMRALINQLEKYASKTS